MIRSSRVGACDLPSPPARHRARAVLTFLAAFLSSALPALLPAFLIMSTPASAATKASAAPRVPRASTASVAPDSPALATGAAFDASPGFTRGDSLFILAATGEPRFQAARDAAELLLRADAAATLAWLVERTARRGRSLTPRQHHTIERLFTLVADSGRNASSRHALARAVAAAPTDTARARWLYIGSRIGDTAFRATARAYVHDPAEAVRRMAVRSLGAYPHPGHAALLWDGLETTHGLERHMRLWALGEQPALRDARRRTEVLRRLAPLLADDRMYNRQKVRDMMLRVADSSWAALADFRPSHADSALAREWRLLARDARGGRAWLEAAAETMSAEERGFFGWDGDVPGEKKP